MDWTVQGLMACRGKCFFLPLTPFSKTSIPVLEAYTPSLSVGTGGSFPIHKVAVYEANNSPPSSAKVKNQWSCTSAPPVCLVAWRGTTVPLQMIV